MIGCHALWQGDCGVGDEEPRRAEPQVRYLRTEDLDDVGGQGE
jgi:hypothetical protein